MVNIESHNDSRPKHRRHSIYATETSGLLLIAFLLLVLTADSLLACHPMEHALTVAALQPGPLLVVVLGPTASGKTALVAGAGGTFSRRNRQLRFGRHVSRV